VEQSRVVKQTDRVVEQSRVVKQMDRVVEQSSGRRVVQSSGAGGNLWQI